MSDSDTRALEEHPADPSVSVEERNPLRRNPSLQIWLIAVVFYAILVGMFLFVLVLIIRG